MTESIRKKYLEALHAMQAGVARMQEIDPHSTTAKHLRVGINAMRSDQGALVSLLVDKGVFTMDEYEARLLKFMEHEKRGYEDLLFERTGVRHTLQGRT